MAAVSAQSLPVVEVLLARGADPARTDAEGRNALDMARQLGNQPIYDALRGAAEQ
jgi:ankyrin repeat protein